MRQWHRRQRALGNEKKKKEKRADKFRTAITEMDGDSLTNRFTSATSTTSTARFDAILLEVCIIGMARAWVKIGF